MALRGLHNVSSFLWIACVARCLTFLNMNQSVPVTLPKQFTPQSYRFPVPFIYSLNDPITGLVSEKRPCSGSPQFSELVSQNVYREKVEGYSDVLDMLSISNVIALTNKSSCFIIMQDIQATVLPLCSMYQVLFINLILCC